ncbi:MAG: translation initiation factor IF-3 [Eubacteriales bacterium]|nr:translation initiation factor IF-3 [Eubacteriales bacterium]
MFKELLINEQITANEVRVIGENGEQLGILKIQEAHELAEKANLDLVCMNNSANPTVCKILNYGKYKFDAIKKEKEAKKNQKITELKEIQLSMTIDTHDLEVKAKHGKRFLEDGNKVKVVLRMRGRQQAYAKNAITVVKNFYAMLEEFGSIDKEPEIVGRNIILIVSPKTK